MKEAGRKLLAATDDLAMQARGAMWVYSHELEEWRYYLVTSLVDTLGRRKTYGLLLDVFERIKLPPEMTIEDVHLGSPSDPFFGLISGVLHVGNTLIEFKNCIINDAAFDAVVYRSVRGVPPVDEAKQIEKRFSKRVRELVAHDR